MINLGDKNWGVKDSGLLAYKQVGSKYFNKDFDFTRASNGTYVDKNGVLQTAELYNLITYSSNFNESSWNYRSGDSSTGGQIGYDGSSDAWLLNVNTGGWSVYQNFVASGVYNFSLYVKKGTIDIVQIDLFSSSLTYRGQFNLTSGTDDGGSNTIDRTITDVGGGWYRISISANVSSILYARIGSVAQTGNFYIQDAQLVEGTEPLDYQYTNGLVGIPRIDFSDGVRALILEPQTTQLMLYSEDFSQYDVVGDITREGGYLAPDGTYTAYKVSGDGAVYYSGLVASTSARSIYARSVSGTGTAQLLSHHSNTNNTFTLTDQWQRFELNSTPGISNNFYAVDFRGGETLDEIIIWGANATDDQTYATSYIKTEGSAVTRIADVANNCGSEQDFNSEEGVLYAEISALADNGGNREISISDGTSNNRVEIRYENTSNAITGVLRHTNNTVSGLTQYIVDDVTDFYKVAFKYKENDFALWINGVEVDTDTNGVTILPNTLSELSFDSGSGIENFYGKVRSIKYFPEALTDEQLENLTT